MRSRIDAARQPGHDRVSFAAEIAGQHARHLDAGQRGIAGTDDGNSRHLQHLGATLDRDQRRRQCHAAQHRGIVGLADGHESRAETDGPFHLLFRMRHVGHADGP